MPSYREMELFITFFIQGTKLLYKITIFFLAAISLYDLVSCRQLKPLDQSHIRDLVL